MLVVELDVIDGSVVAVYHVVSQVGPCYVHHSQLGLGCYYHIVLDKVHSDDFLTVHVKHEQLLLLLVAHANHIALYISKHHNVLLVVSS